MPPSMSASRSPCEVVFLCRRNRGSIRGRWNRISLLGNITLPLRPSAAQQAALEQLLEEQQDPRRRTITTG